MQLQSYKNETLIFSQNQDKRIKVLVLKTASQLNLNAIKTYFNQKFREKWLNTKSFSKYHLKNFKRQSSHMIVASLYKLLIFLVKLYIVCPISPST